MHSTHPYEPLLPTNTVLLNGDSVEEKREEIRTYFHKTFSIYEELHAILKDDKAFYLQPEPLRHPHIFYFGHTATFYVNKLVLAKLLDKRINPSFESMFAIGVDEMSWDDLNKTHYDWPAVEDVRTYRRSIRDLVNNLISTLPLTLPITWESPFWAILMCIEHERIHLETSSVLLRQTDISRVKPNPLFPRFPRHGHAPVNELVPVPEGDVSLGVLHRDHIMYGWDNEYGTHYSHVEAFEASRYLVSNQEYLEFVEAGAYNTPEYWTEEGRAWLEYTKAQYPVFWIVSNGTFKYRALTEEMEMPWDWPVDVNNLEAKAFCNFKSRQLGVPVRLPSEDEWVHLRTVTGVQDEPFRQKTPGNINLEYAASSVPVNRFRTGDFYDVIGNVWQWTETPIYGFDGFKVHPLYDDFSTPTFDNLHNLIKGGSWISTGNEANFASRYAFRRHFFQHAGFRYVQSENEVVIENSVYEEDAAAAQYCEFHYGEKHLGVENFHKRIADIALHYTRDLPRNKALDIGCSVGRISFELASEYKAVIGLDFSARFINLAHHLQTEGKLRYTIIDEGELVGYKEHTLEELGLKENASAIAFMQADACNLKPHYQGFDLVVTANLIDRLYAPRRFLRILHERVNPGGIIVLASPYTWLEEFTKKEEWLGGYKKDGENVFTLDSLHEFLDEHFELLDQPQDVEFVIRETRRKFQHTISEVTVWQRKK
ncbi:MAG: 5-histidylcysteine sulfoxide synthase [Desulfobulbaceae bacterium]|nr:5-histidylcysteine sulfoxide synthase [Desulfobulbaceae bacterium]